MTIKRPLKRPVELQSSNDSIIDAINRDHVVRPLRGTMAKYVEQTYGRKIKIKIELIEETN